MNNPDLYAKNNEPQRIIHTEVVNKYLDKFQWRPDNGDAIIDIGSGPGNMFMEIIWPLLGRKFSRVVLTDLQQKMMDFAKSRYQHVENCDFNVLDIGAKLEIPNNLKGQFDHVVSFNCLQLVENQMKAFQNIYQLLRPADGGDCLLNIFARGPYYEAYLEMSKTPKWSKYMDEVEKYTCYWHYVKNSEQKAQQMLQQCGFTDIDVKLSGEFYEYESVKKVKDTAFAVSPFTDKMPKELHQEFMDDFIETMTSVNENCRFLSDGRYQFYFEQLTIFARRPPNKSNK